VILSISFLTTRSAAILTVLVLLFGCGGVTENQAVKIAVENAELPLLAVFPIQNLSGNPAPLQEIRSTLIDRLRKQGFAVLDDNTLESFMTSHRLRNVGGIDGGTAQALRKETGAEATVITSLELYGEQYPPKIALTCRLVASTDPPVIRWIDNVGMTGDESPGLLGLGLIAQADTLRDKALQTLMDSLRKRLAGEQELPGTKSRFSPKLAFRSDTLEQEKKKFAVAVIPFFNLSNRKNAGEIMVLHFVKELQNQPQFEVVEPGVVLKELLHFRIIMDEGLSLPDAAAIYSDLNVDLILSGKILDYQDAQGPWGAPYVDFSTVMFLKNSREMVWASKSYNTGSDGVFFFDMGRVATANDVASQMARYIAAMMVN
jgi:TolB-like protein